MPRGYTDIHFVGGKMEGEIIESAPLRNLPPKFSSDSDSYFAELPSGDALICKGDRGPEWHSFSREVYEKMEDNKRVPGVTYEYTETVMVERCEAITKKGNRCMKEALEGKTYCSSVHKLNP